MIYISARTAINLREAEANKPEDGWRSLADAIIIDACKEYRRVIISRKGAAAYLKKQELEEFFRGEWFAILTDIDPEYLIQKMKREVMSYEPKQIRRRKDCP